MGSQLTFNFTPKLPAFPAKTNPKTSSVPVLVPAPVKLKQQHWEGCVPSAVSVHYSHGPMRRLCLKEVGTLSYGDCFQGQRVSRGWGNFISSFLLIFEASESILAAPTNTLRRDPFCAVHLHAEFCSMTRALRYHSNAGKQNRNYNSNRQDSQSS